MSHKKILLIFLLLSLLTMLVTACIPKVGEIWYIHQTKLVNPADYSTVREWYQTRTDNCHLQPGAVEILEGPKNGLYLLESGSCQGWGPGEWLYTTPKKE